ncbi:phosphonate C-P lyase system protein PhnH [Mesorhizobium sp. SARCC-RB16n]|uniref:phosphonate C-P lyase system protein PhnH n=1 Tax=Mesorhizobium sp. SARCC-RB16n TaxID=2116687 RepID=UPI001FED8957|nr:phosphonate C-P lyase system protein PhnH [Mesorhizobium sp. SARCC-RB16n]
MSAMETAGIEPGFRDPVFDSQHTFRCILDAFGYVGRAQVLSRANTRIGPLDPATIAVCLTLTDFETPIWLDPVADSKPVRDFLAFHCGVTVTSAEASSFAIVGNPASMPRLDQFALGTDLEPQCSTTLVIQVPAFDGGPLVRLRGPGIQSDISLAIPSLPSWFWEDWQANHELYPIGVDVLFTCGSSVLALPRSVSVEV